MKRRWWIERRHAVEARGYRPRCDVAWWFWVRTPITSLERQRDHVVGCVCHHTWTRYTKSVKVVPDGSR